MKKNGFLVCLAGAVMVLASCGGNIDKNGWYTDFDAAKKAAAGSGERCTGAETVVRPAGTGTGTHADRSGDGGALCAHHRHGQSLAVGHCRLRECGAEWLRIADQYRGYGD